MANQQDQQQRPVSLGKTNMTEVNQNYFYERMVSQLQSEVLSLRAQLKSRKTFFFEDIKF